ncbi:dynein light chain Tctex-type protein 2B-like [Brevipalpus obovatus]|uniref:dynein light chain Tctex-type protein 2B-like n=1 Tax=Brevipalpus obovatus TaxID=246614 RepID=UPI003D9E6D50
MSKNITGYDIRPVNRFDVTRVKSVMNQILTEEYSEREYEENMAPEWCKMTTQNILETLKDFGFHKYKYIVSVTIGEQRGGGCKMMSNSYWDSDTDSVASCSYKSNYIFVVATVFAIYHY